MSPGGIQTMTAILENSAISNSTTLSSFARNRDCPVGLSHEMEKYPHRYQETSRSSPSLPSRGSSAAESELERSPKATASYGAFSRQSTSLSSAQDSARSLSVHSNPAEHGMSAQTKSVRKRPSNLGRDETIGNAAADATVRVPPAVSIAPSVSSHKRGISSDSSTSNICLCQPDPKIPRPRNAFILYRQHHQAAITSKNPNLSNPEISKVLGEQWKAEPSEVKKDWKNLAEEEKHRHQQQYPEYRYQPRRTRRGSTAEGAFGALPSICNKCGNRTMVSPNTAQPQTTPSAPSTSISNTSSTSLKPEAPVATITNTTSQAPRPILPPPQQTMSGATQAATTTTTTTTLSPSANQRILPPMKTLSLATASHNPRKVNRNCPPNIGVMPHNSFQEYHQEDARYPQLSPEAKRRRFNGAYTPSTGTAPPQSATRPTPGTPYGSMISPYRDSFVRNPMDDSHRYSRQYNTSMMPPHSARPSVAYPPQGDNHDSNLTLPPIKDALEARKSVEAMHMSIPYLGKIRILGKISPPFTPPMAPGQQNRGRGTIIAVEGDDSQATAEITAWLGRYILENEHISCRAAEGPAVPEDGKQLAISDYYTVISEWHARSKEMIRYILGMPVSGDSLDPAPQATGSYKRERSHHHQDRNGHSRTNRLTNGRDSTDSGSDYDMEDEKSDGSVSPKNTSSCALQEQPRASRGQSQPSRRSPKKSPNTATGKPNTKPVLILNHYQLHASNAFASSVPINDAYSPVDHWQWMATLWRDIIGPDLTIYVHTNTSPEDNTIGPKVEIHESIRSMIVRKQQGAKIEEKVLRRLGFEVSEWVKSMANGETRGGIVVPLLHHQQTPTTAPRTGMAS